MYFRHNILNPKDWEKVYSLLVGSSTRKQDSIVCTKLVLLLLIAWPLFSNPSWYSPPKCPKYFLLFILGDPEHFLTTSKMSVKDHQQNKMHILQDWIHYTEWTNPSTWTIKFAQVHTKDHHQVEDYYQEMVHNCRGQIWSTTLYPCF